MWKSAYSYLISCIDNIIIKLFVVVHGLIISNGCKNIVFWLLLSSSTFNLNIGFQTGWLIERYNNFATRNIKTLLSYTCCYQNAELVCSEFFNCWYLSWILFFNFKQKFTIFNSFHSSELACQIFTLWLVFSLFHKTGLDLLFI